MTEAIRILIADDHPIVREGLATVLNQEEDLEGPGPECGASSLLGP